MIQVIAGKKGSGKTKRILAAANEASKDAAHGVLFIDDDNRYMFDLVREVRFVNAGEFEIADDKMLLGFLAGAISQNFDISLICIDAFTKLIKIDLNACNWFIGRLELLSKQYNVNFLISISEDPDALPEFLKKYLV